MDLLFILHNDARDDYMTGGADIELVLDDLRFRASGRMFTDRHHTKSRADVLSFSTTYRVLEFGILISGDLNGQQVQEEVHRFIKDDQYVLKEEEGLEFRPFIGFDFNHAKDKPWGWLDFHTRFWGDGGDCRIAAMMHGDQKEVAVGVFGRAFIGNQLSTCVNSIVDEYFPIGVVLEARFGRMILDLNISYSDVVWSLGWRF